MEITMKNKNLKRDTVRLLRKVQKFLMEEPRRFNMEQGIVPYLNGIPHPTGTFMMGEPPCGTVLCIAGAAYAISTGLRLRNSFVGFGDIEYHLQNEFSLDGDVAKRLFFVSGLHMGAQPGVNAWPEFYSTMYLAAKTPLERVCVGVARIEHFIATDGNE